MRGIFLLSFTLIGCGGASANQVSALQSQVDALQTKLEQSQIVSTQEKMAAFEAATIESIRALEKKVAAMESPSTAQATTPAVQGANVGTLEGILGLVPGVTADGDSYRVPSAWLAVAAQNAAASPPKFIPAKKGGISIKGLKPKSHWMTLGLKNNDTIVAVGDNDISDVRSLANALKTQSGAVVVKILRRNKEMTFTYTVEP